MFVTCKYVFNFGLFAIGVNVQTGEEVAVKLVCETFIALLLILLIIKFIGKFDFFFDGKWSSCIGRYKWFWINVGWFLLFLVSFIEWISRCGMKVKLWSIRGWKNAANSFVFGIPSERTKWFLHSDYLIINIKLLLCWGDQIMKFVSWWWIGLKLLRVVFEVLPKSNGWNYKPYCMLLSKNYLY